MTNPFRRKFRLTAAGQVCLIARISPEGTFILGGILRTVGTVVTGDTIQGYNHSCDITQLIRVAVRALRTGITVWLTWFSLVGTWQKQPRLEISQKLM